MATRTTSRDTRTAPHAPSDRLEAPRLRPAGRRRSRPWITVGVLLVVSCALASAVVVGRAGDRQPVLVAARDLSAGQVLSASDVRVVRVAAGETVPTVSAGSRSEVVGRTVAVPVPAGSLLSPRALGPAAYPPQGYAVVGAALEPGRYPPGLARGARVLVVAAGDAESTTAGTAVEGLSAQATVVSVRSVGPQQGQQMVVSLLVPVEDAELVAQAAAAGQVSVVEVAAGR